MLLQSRPSALQGLKAPNPLHQTLASHPVVGPEDVNWSFNYVPCWTLGEILYVFGSMLHVILNN